LREKNAIALSFNHGSEAFLLNSVSSYPLLNFLRDLGFARAPMANAGNFFGNRESKSAAMNEYLDQTIFS
jgi:hypothetical protein